MQLPTARTESDWQREAWTAHRALGSGHRKAGGHPARPRRARFRAGVQQRRNQADLGRPARDDQALGPDVRGRAAAVPGCSTSANLETASNASRRRRPSAGLAALRFARTGANWPPRARTRRWLSGLVGTGRLERTLQAPRGAAFALSYNHDGTRSGLRRERSLGADLRLESRRRPSDSRLTTRKVLPASRSVATGKRSPPAAAILPR